MIPRATVNLNPYTVAVGAIVALTACVSRRSARTACGPVVVVTDVDVVRSSIGNVKVVGDSAC